MNKEIISTDYSKKNQPKAIQQLAETVAAEIGLNRQRSPFKESNTTLYTKETTETIDPEVTNALAAGSPFLLKAAQKTTYGTGNGSKTAFILSQALINSSLKHIAADMNAVDIRSGLETGAFHFREYLQSVSEHDITTEKIRQLATTAASGDEEIGKLIAEAFEKTEKDGLICIKQSASPESTVQASDDMSFNSGYLSPHSANPEEKIKIVYTDPFLLLTNHKVSSLSSLSSLAEQITPTNRPLLIIANTREGEALPAFIINTREGRLRAAVVKAPNLKGFNTEILEDLAILTGGRMIDKEKGDKLEDVKPRDLGTAEKVEVTEDFTAIVEGKGSEEKISRRKESLCELLNKCESTSTKEKLQERMALISGGIAIVNLAASTEEEFRTKEEKAKTAIRACRAAMEEGIVAGGGVALIRAYEALNFLEGDNPAQNKGIAIFREALLAPGLHIAENGGTDGKNAVQKILGESSGYGFNAATGKFESLPEAGIIDAAKTLRLATENAVTATAEMLEKHSEALKAKAG